MTYKQIETSRELRLWLGQIIIPVIGVVLMVPEAREAVVKNIKTIKKHVETKLKRN